MSDRYCCIFYCDKRRDRICCFYCTQKDKCRNQCLNHPDRCGQESKQRKERKHADEIR
jgi:hypothetical protein